MHHSVIDQFLEAIKKRNLCMHHRGWFAEPKKLNKKRLCMHLSVTEGWLAEPKERKKKENTKILREI